MISTSHISNNKYGSMTINNMNHNPPMPNYNSNGGPFQNQELQNQSYNGYISRNIESVSHPNQYSISYTSQQSYPQQVISLPPQNNIIRPPYNQNPGNLGISLVNQPGIPVNMPGNVSMFVLPTRKGGGGRKRKPTHDLDEKKIQFLERNRQAALKCRLRKKKTQETMILKLQLLEQQNHQLEITRNNLDQQVQELTSLLSCHQLCPVYQSNIQSLAAVSSGQPVGLQQMQR